MPDTPVRLAFLTRPQWDWSSPVGPGSELSPTASSSASVPQDPSIDPRVVAAPLQHLVLRPPDRKILDQFRWAQEQWLVLTSPASVQALDQWLFHTGINIMFNPDMRIAAVGSGTNAQLAHYIAQNSADPARAWRIDASRSVRSAVDEKADATALLAAMDAVYQREGFLWHEQMVLIAQGQDSRRTLADGLRDRGAYVVIADLYQRVDISWPQEVWQRIRDAQPKEAAVVLTSTTVVERAVSECVAHGVEPSRIVWATQHAAIAERLRQHGIQSIRRVRLDHAHLTGDLFDDEQYW
jgi:uroporphyrinogen-III synthase